METTNEYIELRKRPKLNPVFEQEENIESVEITDTEKMGKRSKDTTASGEAQQPSTSNTQMIKIQLSVEVSSFTRRDDKERDAKER